jgi:hypothetical protein
VSDPGYRETVAAARWLVALIALGALAPLYAGLAAIENRDALQVAVLVCAAALLVAVALVLQRLRVETDHATLRFRFGPFGRTLGASEIASATAEQCRWWTFGGWGWRFAWREGALVQAFSVPFVRTGVRVTTRRGKQSYLSSRAPERLAAAIMQLVRRREGTA